MRTIYGNILQLVDQHNQLHIEKLFLSCDNTKKLKHQGLLKLSDLRGNCSIVDLFCFGK